MVKKVIILPFSFLLIHFGYIACIPCKCETVRAKYFRVENIIVWPYANSNMITDPTVPLRTDTISLRYEFSIGCVAYQKNPFTELLNTAYACSCNECGYEGTKSKIRTFEITSDSVYNGAPANTSLNNVFKIKRWYTFNPSDG